MRRLPQLGLIATAIVLAAGCLSAAVPCGRDGGPCSWIVRGSDPRLALQAVEVTIAVFTVGWVVRFLLVVRQTNSVIGQLPRRGLPRWLQGRAYDAGVARLVCFESPARLAFCAGLISPTVYLSTGALNRLDRAELGAVLHHEAHHASGYEPLRRLVIGSMADVLCFIPLVKWLADHRREAAELRADDAAVRVVGRTATAGALLAMTPGAAGFAAFSDCAELRARRLLGEDEDIPRYPSLQMVFTSAAALMFAVSVANCLTDMAHLVR